MQKALPATIAILAGRIKVGLTRTQLDQLAESSTNTKPVPPQQLESNLSSSVNKSSDNPPDDYSVTVKTSRRDLAYVLANKLNGGTTVAGTLMIANMVGIKVFATGGIGGVHRQGESTMDVSADLIELGRTPVAVVCSGVKSILDIPRTLEFLETQGVFVAAFHHSSNYDFPAFYTRTSGSKAPYMLRDAREAAKLIKVTGDMEIGSGLLIGVPIPEDFAMDDTLINNAINTAVKDADKAGIVGKAVTPYLLDAISKITRGKSLESSKLGCD